MAGHAERVRRQRAKGCDVLFQFLGIRMDDGHFLVAIHRRAAMARHMLETADHAAARHPVERRAAQCRDRQGVGAQRPIADHVARFGAADVEWCVEIDRDAHFRKFARDGFGVQPRRFDRTRGGDVVEFGKRLASRIAIPFGRLHPRDTAAFLVDRDEGLLAPMNGFQLVGQGTHLLPVEAISCEQDIARRIGILEKGALLSGQARTGDTENGGCHKRRNRSFTQPPQASCGQTIGEACTIGPI